MVVLGLRSALGSMFLLGQVLGKSRGIMGKRWGDHFRIRNFYWRRDLKGRGLGEALRKNFHRNIAKWNGSWVKISCRMGGRLDNAIKGLEWKKKKALVTRGERICEKKRTR